MFELPLFPLNTVLFPSTPLRLHIFEERYKRMISVCLTTHQPFGVVLIRQGREALGPLAEPYSIGCTAQIIQVQRLEEGRMNISAVGLERFRILSLDKHTQSYLIGYVEPYPLSNPEPATVQSAANHLRSWVNQYLAAFAEAGAGQIDVEQLPDEPLEFTYAAAALLQISAQNKQELLSMDTATHLLESLTTIYRREVALVKVIYSRGQEMKGAFSPN